MKTISFKSTVAAVATAATLLSRLDPAVAAGSAGALVQCFLEPFAL